MRVSGRKNWDILNFVARAGDLVYLVYLDFLVSLVWVNKRDKIDPRTG
jgi:hypothetical protein